MALEQRNTWNFGSYESIDSLALLPVTSSFYLRLPFCIYGWVEDPPLPGDASAWAWDFFMRRVDAAFQLVEPPGILTLLTDVGLDFVEIAKRRSSGDKIAILRLPDVDRSQSKFLLKRASTIHVALAASNTRDVLLVLSRLDYLESSAGRPARDFLELRNAVEGKDLPVMEYD
ncbi:hypothetical protein GC174_10285 [bacterium]|nr:hypothetical protein [bacterium]